MLERHAFAITCIAPVLTVLALIRPLSGMRMIVPGLLLAAAALVGIGSRFRKPAQRGDLTKTVAGGAIWS
jgi:hypothetical protein